MRTVIFAWRVTLSLFKQNFSRCLDYSMSIVDGVKKNDNPLKPFSMSSTRSRQENNSGKYRCNALDRTGEQSFSITFEDSSSELWDKNVSRNSDSRSDSSDDSDCDSIGSPRLAEDTTGGIVFETDPLEIKVSFIMVL